MTVAYWIVAGITALLFLAAGGLKLARPREALAGSGMEWVNDFTSTQVKLIGVAEVLGAAGLVLPILLGIAEPLSVVAGVALAVLMVGAVLTHRRRGEDFGFQIGLVVLTSAAAVLAVLVIS